MEKLYAIILIVLLMPLFSGCIQKQDQTLGMREELRLSTTTSTCDTGLLDLLNKKFEKENHIRILTICQGTGRAIATGELGAADVILVHDAPSELRAVANGSFINRSYVMYNYFVIVGPENDPAGIKKARNVSEALEMIAEKQSLFVSRGDESGTHKMEKSLWKAANITPSGTGYISVGKGMGGTLTTADVKQGYTLSDRGTYLAMKDRIKLVILFEPPLLNPYHVMAANPQKFPGVHYEPAKKYIDFMTSPEAKDIIRDFGRDKYGEELFIPAGE